MPPDTPVGARYSPNTSRRAPAHSPVVPPAWARAMVAGMTFAPPSAARRSSSRADRTASASRDARHFSTSSITAASTAGSTRRIDSAPPSGEAAVVVKHVDADDGQLARLDAAGAVGLRADQAALQLVDGLEGAAQGQDVVQLGRRPTPSARPSWPR